MKTTEARISLSPVRSPAKRGVQRIQMSSGIAAMRVSVMELGRFTRRLSEGRKGGQCDYPGLLDCVAGDLVHGSAFAGFGVRLLHRLLVADRPQIGKAPAPILRPRSTG